MKRLLRSLDIPLGYMCTIFAAELINPRYVMFGALKVTIIAAIGLWVFRYLQLWYRDKKKQEKEQQ